MLYTSHSSNLIPVILSNNHLSYSSNESSTSVCRTKVKALFPYSCDWYEWVLALQAWGLSCQSMKGLGSWMWFTSVNLAEVLDQIMECVSTLIFLPSNQLLKENGILSELLHDKHSGHMLAPLHSRYLYYLGSTSNPTAVKLIMMMWPQRKQNHLDSHEYLEMQFFEIKAPLNTESDKIFEIVLKLVYCLLFL